MALPPNDPASGSNLCTHCGLCCNGALFDYGDLQPGEVDELGRAGLRLSPRDDGVRFLQPCTAYRDKLCRVYEIRPQTCRSYRCELLIRLDEGSVSAEEACARVDEAKALLARVDSQLPEGEDRVSARKKWVRAHAPDATAEERGRLSPALTLAMFMLNRILDRHFRRPDQRKLGNRDLGMSDRKE